MGKIKEKALKFMPYLPFVILAVAFLVAVYHIKYYW
jgi:hypothetical protein